MPTDPKKPKRITKDKRILLNPSNVKPSNDSETDISRDQLRGEFKKASQLVQAANRQDMDELDQLSD